MGQLGEHSGPVGLEWGLPWGTIVRGQRWGAGSDVVLLLHEPGSDLDAWGALPDRIARSLDMTAIALDLPGHGLSDDPWKPEQAEKLVNALIESCATLARPELVPGVAPAGVPRQEKLAGAGGVLSRHCVIAAGSAATTVHGLAVKHGLTASILLSPSALNSSRTPVKATSRSSITPETEWRRARATLFLAGSAADHDLTVARRLASTSPGWTVVTSVPGSARGTELLSTPWRDRIEEQIIAFIRDARVPGSVPTRSRIRPRFSV